jgi:hypothetical protein
MIPLWRSKAPLRVILFAWLAILGKILTLENLRKRQIIVVDWCCMCKKSALWNFIFGLAWVMPRRVKDLFACWRGQLGSPQSEAIWKMLPPCLMWCIWRERNDWNFEESERTVVELNTFFNILYQWMAAYKCFHISSFHDFF